MTGWITQPAEVGPNYYLDSHREAGEEVSSTYEGRHVYIQEKVLVHAGAGFVQKGQPVGFWEGVGIALKTATSESENVPIDTEGIWRVSVVAEWDIVIGQSLYISSLGVVTDNPANAMAIFGYSLQTIAEGNTAIIAVKVHWMALNWGWLWWWFEYMQYSWYGN
ncbi:MAG: DUF2190 family protein [Dehalococcoidia bacterium]|nr:DUF2190 family protein [Dehalococcoidia bacterium]